jgi:4-hydroxy-3-methylbut-2-enyl diphosphate reductase
MKIDLISSFAVQSEDSNVTTKVEILRAEHLGMCFGVRDAIALAGRRAAEQPVTVLGDLVHNETVLAELRGRGVRFARQLAEVTTPRVMISAHGTAQRTLDEAQQRGLEVEQATCPLVHFAHRTLHALVAEGFYPVVIGQRDHVEVRGLTGDLAAFNVVLTPEDIDRLKERPRFGVVSQTTQPIARVRELVAHLLRRFPASEVRFRDTVCQPTKQRQDAAQQLARQCDVVIVIGGAHSNNTRELAATCAQHCTRVHHVQTGSDLRREWFTNARRIGITAGTSTPDEQIDTVEQRLREILR